MSMLIPGQNQLAEPAIIAVDEFEPLLAEFKAFVVDYVATRAPQSAAKLKVSLDNESELLTLALEAFCVRLQTHERKYNARIKQMLAWWATGSNLDARLADMGLERCADDRLQRFEDLQLRGAGAVDGVVDPAGVDPALKAVAGVGVGLQQFLRRDLGQP